MMFFILRIFRIQSEDKFFIDGFDRPTTTQTTEYINSMQK